jgi:hypothetical protein
MFNNSALDVNSIGLVMPEANGLVPSPSRSNSIAVSQSVAAVGDRSRLSMRGWRMCKR